MNTAITVLLFVVPAVSVIAADKSVGSTAVARGKQLYYRNGCYGCHGFGGETGVRRLVGSPMLVTPQTFVAYLRLRTDLQPLVPSTRMPSFPASSLSDADALAIYAYVRSFVLHAPDPNGIRAFQKVLESAEVTNKAPTHP